MEISEISPCNFSLVVKPEQATTVAPLSVCRRYFGIDLLDIFRYVGTDDQNITTR
ncbi:hypothetical protein [Trichloromonas acetexigens]|uniref:hypothetical protein n=1 Tax=Trichloromonas acetexigens TaxID=38815 RepID=UPI0014792E33|nr:hypothetical protein [Desulfuromonas acetexigens]